jgi:hypothetical protein
MEEWMRDVQTRPAPVREKLLRTHAEIGEAVFWHIVPWSLLAWACLALALPITVAAKFLKVRVKFVRRPQEISAVLEEDALEQRAVDEECLVAG